MHYDKLVHDDNLVHDDKLEKNCIPSEVVKVVHDDSHEEIEHEEGAEEHKGHKEEEGDVGAAGLPRLQHLTLNHGSYIRR